MVEIDKYKFDRYYAFDIITDEGCFSIVFGGNLDLYWSYKLTFNKCKDDSIYASYSIRIRNSGSRYGYFNIIFMRMYNKLCQYEPNFHQIHIDEYMYQKNLTKIKKTI